MTYDLGDKNIRTRGRLVYVDPNDLASFEGFSNNSTVKDNVYWKPEDLNISVDLQVIIPRRDDAMERNYDGEIFQVTFATTPEGKPNWSTFFGGKKLKENSEQEYLTDAYTDMSYTEIKNGRESEKETLGIESVDISFDSNFYPQVNIRFIDVHGYSLLNPAEYESTKEGQEKAYKNFFKALFHFPYPRFLLTIKGQFGSRVTFTLAPNETHINFNSQTGNFEVDVSFIGYMYGVYTDIPLNFLIVAPYLDAKLGVSRAEGEGNEELRWDKHNFTTAEGDKMPTFIEFINAYNELEQKIADNESVIRGYDALATLKSNTKKIDAYNEAITAYKELIKTFLSDDKYEYNYYRKLGNEKSIDAEALNVVDNSEDKVHYDEIDEKIEILKGNLRVVTTKFMSSSINGTTTYFIPSSIYEKAHEKYKSIIENIVGDGKYKDSNFSIDLISDENSNSIIANAPTSIGNDNSYAVSPQANFVYFTIYLKNIYEDLVKAQEDLKGENEALDEESIKEEQDLSAKLLGFRPTIENMYRMIFAHIDIFMDFFYNDVISKIGKERKISSFQGLKGENLDTKKKPEPLYLPPFPATYELKNGKSDKRTLVYPRKVGNFKVFTVENMPELAFVEKLINAAIQLKKEIKELKPLDSGATTGDYELKYLPLTVADLYFYLNNTEPYEKIRLKDNLTDSLEFFEYYLLRTHYHSRGYLNSEIDEENLLRYEYQNYIKNHPIKKFNFDLNSDKDRIFNKITANGNDSKIITKYIEIDNKNNVLKTKTSNTETIISMSSSINDGEGVFFSEFITDNDANEGDIGSLTVAIEGGDNYTSLSTVKAKIEGLGIEGLDDGIKNMFDPDSYPEQQKDEQFKINNYTDCYTGLNADNCGCLRSNEDTTYKSVKDIGNEKYNEIITNALSDENDKIGYTLRTLNILGNDKKTLVPVFYNNADKTIFSEGLTTTDGKNFDPYKLFFYVLSSLPYSLRIYHNIVHILNNHTGLWHFPLGAILYIGGMIYASEHATTVDKEWSFIPGHKTGKEPKRGVNILRTNINGHGFVNKLTIDHDEDTMPIDNLFDEKSCKLNKLKNLFIQYANEFYNICHDEFNSSIDENNWIIKGSSLDRYLVKLFLKKCIVTNQNFDISNSGSTNISTSIENFLQTASGQAEALEETEGNTDETDEGSVSMDMKLAAYNTLKNLYDKWITGYKYEQFILPTPEEKDESDRQRFRSLGSGNDTKEFNNFLFIDSLNNDISDKFYINMRVTYDLLMNQILNNENGSAFEFMASIAQKNKLLFLSLPVYNNFYNGESLKNMFVPHNIYNPFYSKGRSAGSTYILMYTHEVSHMLEETEDGEFESDGIDLTDPLNIFHSSELIEDGEDSNYMVPAFAVTMARQNQGYFKNIQVNMDNPRQTDYSIANTFELAQVGRNNTTDPMITGQDLFSIYSNRSYNCTVEMMGCANIMPLMYFQLNNIPMFKGAYMIINVRHHIQAGDMTTTFSGVKMSKNLIPFTKHLFNIKLFRDGLTNGSGYGDGYMGTGTINDFSQYIKNNEVTIDLYRVEAKDSNNNGNVVEITTLNTEGISDDNKRYSIFGYMAIGDIKLCDTLENDYHIKSCRHGPGERPNETVGYGDKDWTSHHTECREYASKFGLDRMFNISGSGCLFHPGPNALQNGKPWTTGCVLIQNNPEHKWDVRTTWKASEFYDITFNQWTILYSVLATAKNQGIKMNLHIHQYGEKYNGTLKNYVPCSSADVVDATGVNQTSMNTADVNKRGKAIMTRLQSEFEFTDEQVIGIGSALYQESRGWNPTSVSNYPTSKYPNGTGASGIMQAMPLKGWFQDSLVKLLKNNGITGTTINGQTIEYDYDHDRYQGNFIKIPFADQLNALVLSLKEGAIKGKVVNKIKQCKTAEEAAEMWNIEYEKSETKGLHERFINIARAAFKS